MHVMMRWQVQAWRRRRRRHAPACEGLRRHPSSPRAPIPARPRQRSGLVDSIPGPRLTPVRKPPGQRRAHFSSGGNRSPQAPIPARPWRKSGLVDSLRPSARGIRTLPKAIGSLFSPTLLKMPKALRMARMPLLVRPCWFNGAPADRGLDPLRLCLSCMYANTGVNNSQNCLILGGQVARHSNWHRVAVKHVQQREACIATCLTMQICVPCPSGIGRQRSSGWASSCG